MSLAQPLVSTEAGPAHKQPAVKEQPLVGEIRSAVGGVSILR